MKRRLLGMLLAFVGLVTFTQADLQALGCRWGGSGWYPCAAGGSGFGYGYRYNFGGCGGYGAYVGLGCIGYNYGYCGAIGSSYGGYVTHRTPYGYGIGRCGFGLSSSGSAGKITSWEGYSPDVYAVSCQMGVCASGDVAETTNSVPEVAASSSAEITTVSYTEPTR